MEISIHHSQINEFLKEIDASNFAFEEFAEPEQRIQLECNYIKTERFAIGPINTYNLELIIPKNTYKYVALLESGLITVNPEFKERFKEFGSELNQNFKCERCGKSVFRKVFICLSPEGTYKYFGGGCIDIVYPQYKYITQVYKRFSAFYTKYNCSGGSGESFSFDGTRFYWYQDILLVFNYLYPKFKINPEYYIKNDSDLLNPEYYIENKLPEFTDELKNQYIQMLSYYIESAIPTDNDFMFNLHTVAKHNFNNKNYVIQNNMGPWIVAVYLKQLFQRHKAEIVNPYAIGDKFQDLEVTILSIRNYEEIWGHRSQYKTEYIFALNDDIRFVFSTTIDLIYNIGDVVKLSGTIKYISGKRVKFNKINKWKINKPEIIEEL